MKLSSEQLKVLEHVRDGITSAQIAELIGMGQGINSIVHSLEAEKLLSSKETAVEEIRIGKEGKEFAKTGLPERRALEAIGTGIEMKELAKKANLKPFEIQIALMWLKKKDWAVMEKGKLALTQNGKGALTQKGKDEHLLEILAKGPQKAGELKGYEGAINDLKGRKNNIEIKETKSFALALTPEGKSVLKNPEKHMQQSGVEALTHEMLKTGEWRNKRFRKYDISQAPEIWPAKIHPLRAAIQKIKRTFLEMGFTEAKGNFIESSFWNFDALFQPQDHPARDLADTFYMKGIEHDLPKHHTHVKHMHEKGGNIDSTGWKYEWNAETAKKAILRTHTTAVSARELAKLKPPAKVFSVGRVFRNETLDYKHLAEFYQVEGIVVGEDVNFKNLLWYLKQFYNKLGFKKVRFRPAYFPYTELSCEPEVYFEEKKEWVELGGSGIFRPEVVKPLLGVESPVLAWGLGLERPLMLKMGVNDLRTFYRNDLDWLRSSGMKDSI